MSNEPVHPSRISTDPLIIEVEAADPLVIDMGAAGRAIGHADPRAQKVTQEEKPTPLAPEPQTATSQLTFVLFPARIFLALGWARSAVEKAVDPDWWSGDAIVSFLAEHQGSALWVDAPFLGIDGVPAMLLAVVVLLAEAAVSVCLLTGRLLRPALWVACTLNASFIALGAVTPSTFYLVLQMTLLFGLAVTRRAPESSRSSLSVGFWLLIALAMLPLVRTMHPSDVIEDPAIVLATLAVIRAATLAVFAFEGSSELRR